MDEFHLFLQRNFIPLKKFSFLPFYELLPFWNHSPIWIIFGIPSSMPILGSPIPPSAKDKEEGRKLLLHNSFEINDGAYNFRKKLRKFTKFGQGNYGKVRVFYYRKSLVTLYMFVSSVCYCLKTMLQICINSDFAGLKIWQCAQKFQIINLFLRWLSSVF